MKRNPASMLPGGLFALVCAMATLLALLATAAVYVPAARASVDEPRRLRFVHAIPELGPVDVFIDGKRVFAAATFFSVSDYIEIPADSFVEVLPAGQNPDDDHPLLDRRLHLAAGDYSIAARGSLNGRHTDLSLFKDDNQLPDSGQVSLRVVHLAPDAPAVDILVDGERVIADLRYRHAAHYLQVPPGTYTVGVAPAGNDTPIYEVDVTLDADTVYTAWANGLLDPDAPGQAFKVTPSVDATAPESFRLRAIHAVPDIAGNPVDVFVDGEKVVTFDFFDATDYLTLFEGTYDIRVALADTGPENAVIQAEVTFEGGKDYSVVARGTADPSDAAELGASVYEDDNSAPTPGQVRLRVAHLSPDAPTVDILVNGDRVVENLRYLDTAGYLEVAPGDYTVEVAPAGGDPIYSVDVTLTEGTVYTAWANGLLTTSAAVQAFKVTPTVDAEFGESFRLRAIHAVPDIAGNPVDVFVDDEKVVTFDFFDATDYLTLFEGTYDIRVALAGAGPENAVIQAEVTFEGGKDYSVVARGTADPTDAAELGASVYEDDNSAPTPGQVRLRVAHLSPDAPAVDILVNGDRVVENLRYLDTAGYLEVAPGDYTVEVAPTGGDPIYSVDVTLESGTVYTAWANGLLTTSTAAQEFKVTPTVDAEFGAAARVRALNASMGDLAIDVVFDTGLTISGLEPGKASEYEIIMPGDYEVLVKVAGTDITITRGDFRFVAGADYTLSFLAAIESATRNAALSENTMLMALRDDNRTPAAGMVRIRLLSAMPNAGPMNLNIDGETVLSNIGFMQSQYAEVSAGMSEMLVTSADGSTILSYETMLDAGTVSTLVLLDGTEGAMPLLLTDATSPAVAPAPSNSGFEIFLPLIVR